MFDGLTLDGTEGFLLRFAATSLALGVIWRMWVKPMVESVAAFLEEQHELASLISTEFQVDGGATIKDAINSLLESQEHILEWMKRHESTYPNGHG